MSPSIPSDQGVATSCAECHMRSVCSTAHASAAQCSAAPLFIALSDERDAALAARAAARAEGYRAGLAAAESAYEAGYAACAADVKAAQHAIYRPLAAAAEAERGRWRVRGEARTRATFGAPHPADYRGGPVAWPELAPEVAA